MRPFVDQNPQLRFVGSCTAGSEHLAIDALNKLSIPWAVANGCNANAVADYVLCCLAGLLDEGLLHGKRVGVIGIGAIGSRVASRLQRLGFQVLQHDPPKELRDKHFRSVPLSEFRDLDLICLHPALTDSSRQMIDTAFLKQQKPGCVLLNASRGEVVDEAAILERGEQLVYCTDVWQNEPMPNPELMNTCHFGTPHIAGYSQLAKLRGSHMIYQRLCQALELPATISFDSLLKGQNIPDIQPKLGLKSGGWINAALHHLNPTIDTEQMQHALKKDPGCFDHLRKHYPLRPEFQLV